MFLSNLFSKPSAEDFIFLRKDGDRLSEPLEKEKKASRSSQTSSLVGSFFGERKERDVGKKTGDDRCLRDTCLLLFVRLN